MSALAERILSHWPAHLEAGDSGKQLFQLVSDLALPLEQLTLEVGGVRRSHRLGDTRVLTDALRVAAFHGLGPVHFELLFLRFAAAARHLETLNSATDAAAREQAAEELLALWGLAAPAPQLALFDPTNSNLVATEPPLADPGNVDGEVASGELGLAVGRWLSRRRRVDAIETQVAEAARIHVGGNGTVRALLRAAANLLGLEVVAFFDSEDRFWHAATVRDRLRLERRVGLGEESRRELLEPSTEVLGLEENPRRRRRTGAVERGHGHLFSVLRKGFETARLRAHVEGVGEGTLGPLLINRDEGRGLFFRGQVPAGSALVFSEEGRAHLDGADITSNCASFKGACFAGADASPQRDFVFADTGEDEALGKPAHFILAEPPGKLRSQASFPHDGRSLVTPGVAVGETRFAFFVKAGHVSASAEAPGLVEPGPFLGSFDRSLFAPAAPDEGGVAAKVELSWLEHEAYAARLLLPPRFLLLENAEDSAAVGEGFRPVTEIVKTGLERFKPAGVEVRVEVVDERWTLGQGVLAGEEGSNPIDRVRSGIRLWAAEPSTD